MPFTDLCTKKRIPSVHSITTSISLSLKMLAIILFWSSSEANKLSLLSCSLDLDIFAYPPVCDINRTTAGSARRKSKSWPFGFMRILSKIAFMSGASSLGCSRNNGIKSTLSSCPKHKYYSPLQVMRTRLQLSQKLWECGEIKPIFVCVPFTCQ